MVDTGGPTPILGAAAQAMGLNLTLLTVLLVGTVLGILLQAVLLSLWRLAVPQITKTIAGVRYSKANSVVEGAHVTEEERTSIQESHLAYAAAKAAAGDSTGAAEMRQLLPKVSRELSDDTIATMVKKASKHSPSTDVFQDFMWVVCSEMSRRRQCEE
ncbi:MAG: hypothetical protein P4L93_09905 [Coriobacteriia bacterium]|nr:hypothetical protein [Coriobacteriia bacterium]